MLNNVEILIIAIVSLLVYALIRWIVIRSISIKNRVRMNSVLTNIAHELVTPLTVMSASVEQLRRLEPQQSAVYDTMDLNINRTQRLLQQILETSKLQSGELRLLVSNGDIMKFVRQAARCIEPLMKRKQIAYSVTCKPESMMGWIDPDKVDKILVNLLSNAAKYTPEGGSVTVSAETNSNFDQVLITVSDTGIGIPKSRQKSLFTRFYDGDYRSQSTSGTGLGLPLMRDLVYLHRGTLTFSSEEGQGTTFTVRLPIGKEAFATSQVDERHMLSNVARHSVIDAEDVRPLSVTDAVYETAPPSAPHVLIVEDNSELLQLMRHLLATDYRILTAANGRQALDVVRTTRVDIIVSDVMMPEMNGIAMTAALKEDYSYRHLPVILITAAASDDARKEALAAGADDCIVKPFKMGDLRLRMDNILANRQRMRLATDTPAEHVEDNSQEPQITHSQDFLQRAVACVSEHLDDPDFDRTTFAAAMGASSSSLYSKLRQLTGLNVNAFIRDMRMKAACRIAKEHPDYRVSEIAYMVGYKDPKYFATTFKRQFGSQPKEYFVKLREEQ